MTQEAYDYFKKNRKKPGRKKAVDKEK
jgi:hypothetical protein